MKFKTLKAMRAHYYERGSSGCLYQTGAGLIGVWNEETQNYDWYRGDGDRYIKSGSTIELTADATLIGSTP